MVRLTTTDLYNLALFHQLGKDIEEEDENSKFDNEDEGM